MSTAITQQLLTAEEYAAMPETGPPTELVNGRIVVLSRPTPRHGEIVASVTEFVGSSVRSQGLGRLVAGDSAVRTTREPDSVRGPDAAFYSFQRMPRGPMPNAYSDIVPEVVFEVLSKNDRWRNVSTKVGEYLAAGVSVVCILDPEIGSVIVYRDAEWPQTLHNGDELTLPDILGDFRVPVRRFFE